ncbi:hypothetical protein ScPMuIL_009792 [Solemya velum]
MEDIERVCLYIEAEVIVTRVMVVLAILCGIVATFLSILWAVGIGFTKFQASKMIIVAVGLAVVVFGVTGLLVYTTLDMTPSTNFSWSFVVVTVGVLCGAFGVGCLIPGLLRNS